MSHEKFVRKLLKKVVGDISSPGGKKESSFFLDKYITNSDTRDMVYEELLSRSREEGISNEHVLNDCLDVIESNLVSKPPSDDVWSSIHTFVRPLQSGRGEISRKARTIVELAREHGIVDDSGEKRKSMGIPASVTDHSRPSPHPSSFSPLEPIDLLSPQEWDVEQGGNVLLARTQHAKRRPGHRFETSSSSYGEGSLAHTSLALPQFSRGVFKSSHMGTDSGTITRPPLTTMSSAIFASSPSGKSPITIPADSFSCRIRDCEKFKSQVETIRESLLAGSARSRRLLPHHMSAKRDSPPIDGCHLFQFKFYIHQEPLQLSPSEMSAIVDSLLTPGEAHPQTMPLAIKTIMDMYSHKNVRVRRTILYLFFEMLETRNERVILRILDLVWNIVIHAHIFEEKGYERHGHEKTKAVIHDVFLKFCCVQERMLDRNILEFSSNVWNSILKLTLLLVRSRDKIDLDRAHTLDLRMFPIMAERCTDLANPKSQIHFVELLMAAAYGDPSSSHTFRASRIQKMGGFMEWLRIAGKLTSFGAMENMMVLLVDLLNHELGGKLLTTPFAEEKLLKSFEQVDASFYLRLLCLHFDPRSVNSLMKMSICEESQMPVDSLGSDVKQISIRSLVASLWDEIERQAKHSTMFSEENRVWKQYQSMLAEISSPGSSGSQNVPAIRGFLLSPHPCERLFGELWIVNLIRNNLEDGYRMVESVLDSLVASGDPRVWEEMIWIMQRVVVLILSDKPPDEQAAHVFMNHMLRKCLKIIVRKEWKSRPESYQRLIDDVTMFAVRLMNTFFFLIGTPRVPFHARDRSAVDTVSQMFLEGDFELSASDLPFFDVQSFITLFNFFSDAVAEQKELRILLLFVIAEKCRANESDFEYVGGPGFFEGLVNCGEDKNPPLQWIASQFLVDYLKRERPEHYRVYLSRVLSLAQREHNARILKNPYLLLKEFSAMDH